MLVPQRGVWLRLRYFPHREPCLRYCSKTAEKVLADSFMEADEIFGPETFATVAAVVALGEQLRGRGMILSAGNNAESGALINAPPRVQAILRFFGSFCGYVAQLSASCMIGRVSSEAIPECGPGRNKPLFLARDVEGNLASFQMSLTLRRALGGTTKLAAIIP